MGIQLVNLDGEKNTVISLSYNGELRVLSRGDIVELLAMRERLSKGESAVSHRASANDEHPPAKPKHRTLASLGAIIGPILRSGKISDDDQKRILMALQEFDGDIKGRRSSQVGHWLRQLHGTKVSADLKAEIVSFLKKYPGLEKVPKRN